ncbi:hypothetical protein BC567DRAFT_227448 [Phyllosticta citribraziliensis]
MPYLKIGFACTLPCVHRAPVLLSLVLSSLPTRWRGASSFQATEPSLKQTHTNDNNERTDGRATNRCEQHAVLCQDEPREDRQVRYVG